MRTVVDGVYLAILLGLATELDAAAANIHHGDYSHNSHATAPTQPAKEMASVGLAPCGRTPNASQEFSFSVVPPYTSPAAVAGGSGICLELPAYRTNAKRDRPPTNLQRPRAGETVGGWHCGVNSWTNQYWALERSTLRTLQPDARGLCLGMISAAGGQSEATASHAALTRAALAICSSAAAQFNFTFSGGRAKSRLVHQQTGLCVTLMGQLPPPPTPAPRPPSPKNTPCPPPRSAPAPAPPSSTLRASSNDRPCDIFGSAGTPCVAAHSMVRALYSAYSGPLYMLQRGSDYTNTTIRVLGPGGFANASAQDAFCEGTDCEVIRIFDQSPRGNHLLSRHPGRHFPVDYGVNASAQPVIVGGHHVYGARFDEGMGYRNDHTSGLAVGCAVSVLLLPMRHARAACHVAAVLRD